MTDDFAFSDKLQDDVDAAISEAIPFEPDVELREDTAHEEPVDADGQDVEPDNIADADPEEFDILDGIEIEIEEGSDDR